LGTTEALEVEETDTPGVDGAAGRGGGEEAIDGGGSGEEEGGNLLCPPAASWFVADEEAGGALASVGLVGSRGSGSTAEAIELGAGGIVTGFSAGVEWTLPVRSAAVGREFCGSAEAEAGSRIVLVCCAALCASTSFPT